MRQFAKHPGIQRNEQVVPCPDCAVHCLSYARGRDVLFQVIHGLEHSIWDVSFIPTSRHRQCCLRHPERASYGHGHRHTNEGPFITELEVVDADRAKRRTTELPRANLNGDLLFGACLDQCIPRNCNDGKYNEKRRQ